MVLVVGCEARVRARPRAKGGRRERGDRTESGTCVAIRNGEREGRRREGRKGGRKEGRKGGKRREAKRKETRGKIAQCVSVPNGAFR